jgi:hypothetical protein
MLPILKLCGRGETANTAVFKTATCPGLWVRVPPSAPPTLYPEMTIRVDKQRALPVFYCMVTEAQIENRSKCGGRAQRFGKHRNGLSRFRCVACKITFTEQHKRILGGYLSEAKVTLASVAA